MHGPQVSLGFVWTPNSHPFGGLFFSGNCPAATHRIVELDMISSLIRRALTLSSSPTIRCRWLSSDAGSMPMDVVHLAARSVLRVSGPQSSAVSFLQGMVTNDMRALDSTYHHGLRAVYAALLSPKGKVLHDLILSRDKDQEDGAASILVDVDAGGAEGAMGLLNRYKMRRPVLIEDLSLSHQVFAAFPSSSQPPGSTPLGSQSLDPARIERGWKEDPRISAL